jgi:indolepyruvate ferredoxin oxidoreductase beta subunit
MRAFKLVISGVGGQGTLLASRLIASSSIEAGLPVKIGETYGMAQRGGPVMGHIQIGENSGSPQIRKGSADVILGFEIGEAVRRGVSFLKMGGLAIVNSRKFPPVEVISGMMDYPSEKNLLRLLHKITEDIVVFDATSLAEKAGDAIATNIVMLGALASSKALPFKEDIIIDSMKRNLRPSLLEVNLNAFKLGKEAYQINYSST